MKNKIVLMMAAIVFAGWLQAGFGQSLNDGLVAYYPFNGNANDESGNGNDGIVNGAALIADRFGATGKAYNFDGGSYIKTSSGKNFPTNGDFTVSLWFTFDFPLASGQGRLIANQMSDQFQLAFDTWTSENPKIQFYSGGGAPVLNATELQWNDKKWYDVTLVRRGNLYSLYRDGIEVFSSSSPKVNNASGSDLAISIGGGANTNHPWKGNIDDVRIYDRALSESEVVALHELESTPNSTYQIVEGNFTWEEAKADAEARGGHLATITSELEQQKINDLTKETNKQNKHFWLGATDQESEGNWKWITGELWNYENWQDGPSSGGRFENVLSYHGPLGGVWNDLNDTHRFVDGYILEIPKVDLENGLVAYYPFNGNANDESGKGNNGEVNGSTLAIDRFGYADKAYSFDGSSTIAVPHSKENSLAESESFTFSIWVNSESSGTHIFGKRGDTFNYQLDLDQGAAWFRGGGEREGIRDSENLDLNEWINLIFTWDGSSSAYYKNGQLTRTSFIQDTPALGLENNNPFLIGGSSGYSKFVGELDDIRIYNRALSEAEVAALYELESPLNSIYQIVEGNFTWHEAKADAEARGGHLATITSEGEQAKINEIIKNTEKLFWLGATDEESESIWKWVTAESFSYVNWDYGGDYDAKKGQDYMFIRSFKSLWGDQDKSVKKSYILEIPKVELEQGLVAYYPFNGNANDESGNGNDGAVNGPILVDDRNGDKKSAYEFDGINDKIVLPNSDVLKVGNGSFSLSIWVKANETKGRILMKSTGGNYPSRVISLEQFQADAGIGQAAFFVRGPNQSNNTYTKDNKSLLDDEWHLLTGVKNEANDKISLYVNDVKVDERTFSGDAGIDGNWHIGTHYTNETPAESFEGLIDDIRIYNRALSEAEVAALYELEKPDSDEPKNIITSQPQSGSFANGSTITIKVGVDDSYDSAFIQWFKNGQPIAGENSAELTITNASENSSGDYYALISAGGKAETSDTAKVLILDRPEITSISENAVIDEGETIELVVEVSGQLPFSYQWKKSGSDSTISNFSSLTLKDVDESTSGQYYVIVSNAGGEAISPAINVVVRPDTDNDGLLDYVEIGIGTDITKSDTDGDGLGDFAEVRTYKTNPLSTDSDGDGLPDDVELREGFDPLVGTEAADGAFTVHTAIELEFFTLKSQQYIIQSSTDLENWEDETDKFQGKGGFYSIFASTREKQYSFWRLKVVE